MLTFELSHWDKIHFLTTREVARDLVMPQIILQTSDFLVQQALCEWGINEDEEREYTSHASTG